MLFLRIKLKDTLILKAFVCLRKISSSLVINSLRFTLLILRLYIACLFETLSEATRWLMLPFRVSVSWSSSKMSSGKSVDKENHCLSIDNCARCAFTSYMFTDAR